MQNIKLNYGDGTFEDDRRFALLYDTSGEKFDGEDPEWLHKVCLPTLVAASSLRDDVRDGLLTCMM